MAECRVSVNEVTRDQRTISIHYIRPCSPNLSFLFPNDLTTPASSNSHTRGDSAGNRYARYTRKPEAPPPSLDLPGKHIATDETSNDCYSLLSTNCMQIIFDRAGMFTAYFLTVSTSKGKKAPMHFAVPSLIPLIIPNTLTEFPANNMA